MINIAGIVHNGRASGGSMRTFIFAAVLAASIGALFGGSYASLPQVYQSYSTKQVVGWEDSEGYHDCRKQACILPESYDLIWVE